MPCVTKNIGFTGQKKDGLDMTKGETPMNDRIRMMYKVLNMYQRRGWKWVNGMYGNQWKSKWVRGKGYFRIVRI